MSPEQRMLVWEQWRQTRAYLILPLFVLLVNIGGRLLVGRANLKEQDLAYLTDVYVFGALMLAALVFCLHFDRRMTLRLGTPPRTFRLPMSSRDLVLTQLGFRIAIVFVIYFFCLLAHQLFAIATTTLPFFGSLVFLMGFYALALGVTSLIQPYTFRAKAWILSPLGILAAVAAYPAWIAATVAPLLYAVVVIPAGLGLAIWGYLLARHGGVQWGVTGIAVGNGARYHSVADIPRFASANEAQDWLETRRHFWLLPLIAGFAWLLYLSIFYFRIASEIVRGPITLITNVSVSQGLILLPATIVGILLLYKDYKEPDTALGRFVFTRPVGPDVFARARLRMAAKSLALTVALYICVFIPGILLLISDNLAEVLGYLIAPFEHQAVLNVFVQFVLELALAISLAFAILFILSRGLILICGFAALFYFVLGNGQAGQLEVAVDGAALAALILLTLDALRLRVVHPRILHFVFFGLGGWYFLLILHSIARSTGYVRSSHQEASAFPGLDLFPAFGGILVLLSFTTVVLAVHRRRSQSWFGAKLQQDPMYFIRRRRIVLAWVGGVALVLSVGLLYHARLHRDGALELQRIARTVSPDSVGAFLKEKESLWHLDKSDWDQASAAYAYTPVDRGAYRAIERAYADLALARNNSPALPPQQRVPLDPALIQDEESSTLHQIALFHELPTPGAPLDTHASIIVEALSSAPDYEALEGQYTRFLHDPPPAQRLKFEEAVDFYGGHPPMATFEYFLMHFIWHLADKGQDEEAWRHFLDLLRLNTKLLQLPDFDLQRSRAMRSRGMAQVFSHLVQVTEAPVGVWREMLAILPEEYNYQVVSLAIFARTVDEFAYFSDRRSPAKLVRRAPHYELEYESDAPPQMHVLDHALYTALGLKAMDQYYYLDRVYRQLSRETHPRIMPLHLSRAYIPKAATLTHKIVAPLEGVYYGAHIGQVYEQLLRTAAATLAYRDATGELPQRLSALVPTYLPHLPVDPFSRSFREEDGRGVTEFSDIAYSYTPYSQSYVRSALSFHYRVLDDGRAEIYSLGHNGQDDFRTRVEERLVEAVIPDPLVHLRRQSDDAVIYLSTAPPPDYE